MELYELHIGNGSFGTIDHGNAVASGNHGVGSREIDGSAATRTHHRHFGKVCVHLLRVGIQHIGTVALDVR